MTLNSAIFREYDVRGREGSDLTPEVAYLIGRGFGAEVRESGGRTVVVGYDNRSSSGSYALAARSGLADAGAGVIDVGLVVTPILYYSQILFSADAGVMVTGSHNPPGDNGFKLAGRDGALHGKAIQAVRERIAGGRLPAGQGTVRAADAVEPYLAMVRTKIGHGGRSAPPGLKVAVDCGNGTASLFAPRLLTELGHVVVPLHCVSDPTFPNHFPDPVVKANLVDLVKVVLASRADLGVAFDGDADRLGVVDDEGGIVWGDLLMALFWREILPRYPGAEALVEVKCSQALVEEVRRLGGCPRFCRTGHSLVKALMRETGAPFAGEMSGHLFFADEYYGYDDALYAAARLLRLLQGDRRRLSDLVGTVPRYFSTPEIRIPCSDEDKFRVVAELREKVQTAGQPAITVDGVRMVYPDGWSLVRASNTQPVLVLRCEGQTLETLERIKTVLATELSGVLDLGAIPWE